MDEPSGGLTLIRLGSELTRLRERVTGVRGVVVAGVDGLLLGHEGAIGHDPHDLAAIAAAAYGIGRRCGALLGQGTNQQVAIQNATGHYVVYDIDDEALLAVVAETGLNIAQLHIEFRASVATIGRALREDPDIALRRQLQL